MLIDKARELGMMLSESSEFIRLSKAKCALADNEMVTSLLDEFYEKSARLADYLAEDGFNGAETVCLTSDIERLHDQIDENPILSELIEAEHSFKNLLAAVNQEINACIGGGKNCAGPCESCGGCASTH